MKLKRIDYPAPVILAIVLPLVLLIYAIIMAVQGDWFYLESSFGIGLIGLILILKYQHLFRNYSVED